MRTYTIDDIMALKPCDRYDRAAVAKLYGRRKELGLIEILSLGEVPVVDRLWVFLAVSDDRTRRLFAADCAERVLPIYEKVYPCDDRPRKCIDTARRYANGEATQDELHAARSAAGSAAWAAAGSAAWAAAGAAAGSAAGAAAWAAAGDAARAAAWEWQIGRAKYYVEEEEEK